MDPRYLAVLKSLNDHEVKYVVIGAVAFPAHGYVRATDDLDILFEPVRENAARLRKALEALGYPIWDASDDELLTKKLLFRDFDPEIDTHPTVKGADWDTVWKRRMTTEYAGVRIPVASIEDLIAMKRAAGRAKDVEDLKYLDAIAARKPGAAG